MSLASGWAVASVISHTKFGLFGVRSANFVGKSTRLTTQFSRPTQDKSYNYLKKYTILIKHFAYKNLLLNKISVDIIESTEGGEHGL
jgi:hypothetical protein